MIIKALNKNGETLTEFSQLSSVEINQTLNDSANSFFVISTQDPQATYENLKESNRFEFYDDNGVLIFEAFMNGIDANLNTITVNVSDQAIWEKKIILTDHTYAIGSGIASILIAILGEINAREDTGFVIDSDVTDTITSEKNYSAGASFLSILKDLSDSGFEFITKQGKIIFKKTIGTDRTLDDANYYEFYYNVQSPQGNNVESVGIAIPNNIYNVVVAKDSNGNVSTATDSESIVIFGRLEKVISVSGDLATAANSELQKTKGSTKDIEITPILSDFSELNIGDLVFADITTANDLINFSGGVKILEKNFSRGEKNTYKLRVSSTGNRVLNFFQQFSLAQKNIKKLLIK